MKISVEVTDEELRNTLISAVEGGISYWAVVQGYDHKRGVVQVAEHNDSRKFEDWGPWHTVALVDIAKGMELCAALPSDECGWAFGAFMRDRCGDAQTADIFMQLAVLGEVKYG